MPGTHTQMTQRRRRRGDRGTGSWASAQYHAQSPPSRKKRSDTQHTDWSAPTSTHTQLALTRARNTQCTAQGRARLETRQTCVGAAVWVLRLPPPPRTSFCYLLASRSTFHSTLASADDHNEFGVVHNFHSLAFHHSSLFFGTICIVWSWRPGFLFVDVAPGMLELRFVTCSFRDQLLSLFCSRLLHR